MSLDEDALDTFVRMLRIPKKFDYLIQLFESNVGFAWRIRASFGGISDRLEADVVLKAWPRSSGPELIANNAQLSERIRS